MRDNVLIRLEGEAVVIDLTPEYISLDGESWYASQDPLGPVYVHGWW